MAYGEKSQNDVPKNNQTPRWTVMIFMIAEHLFEWADLSREANETIDEIASLPLPNWLQVRVPASHEQ
jgi:hypothetical protein